MMHFHCSCKAVSDPGSSIDTDDVSITSNDAADADVEKNDGSKEGRSKKNGQNKKSPKVPKRKAKAKAASNRGRGRGRGSTGKRPAHGSQLISDALSRTAKRGRA